LEPLGIPTNKRFSWNDKSVSDITKLNPSITDFVTPKQSSIPFPIIGSTLVGPSAGGTFGPGSQNYTMMEFTPLYVGHFRNLDVDYTYKKGLKHTKRVGGAIESFAYGKKGSSPTIGLGAGQTSAYLNVPEPDEILDLAAVGGLSSYAPGTVFESLTKNVSEILSMSTDYWSPTEKIPRSESFMFGDGGSTENILLISLLQRKVKKVVLFFTSQTPLQPSSKWNVDEDAFSNSQITDAFSCFFGALQENSDVYKRAFYYTTTQVFATSEYSRVIKGLQAAQSEGNGIIASFNLTTIENKRWGIPAGFEVEVTFVYMGRLAQWEQKLPKEMQDLVIPSENADDLSVTVSDGPFKSFPHYTTKGGDINFEQANLLADMTGWSVLQHAELFRRVLA
jgi:hypothetical protein